MPVTHAEPGHAPESLARLLEDAANGRASAWESLVNLYSSRIFALAQSRCRNTHVAEEITQSVLATLAIKLPTGEYAEQGRFESWLFRIAMNRVRDHLRRVKRRPEALSTEALDEAPTLADPADSAPDLAPALAQLRAALAQLSDDDRDVVELRHHGNLSFRQIADLLDEPLGTVLARHHRALKKLKDVLDAKPHTPQSLLPRATP